MDKFMKEINEELTSYINGLLKGHNKALLAETLRRIVLARNKAKDRSEFRGFSKAISILREMAGEAQGRDKKGGGE